MGALPRTGMLHGRSRQMGVIRETDIDLKPFLYPNPLSVRVAWAKKRGDLRLNMGA